ncbi:MAG: outer membrane lipoprotein-sorting protein [Paludibacter sp.]|jgi:outer membrane lipoprotein-sorting protein|nr:outer membrane lipoprotein-sorting protein [Bacteroidales bacterium]
MKLKHFIATLILLVVPVTYGTVTAQDAEEISEKAMDAIKIQDMEMISTINIYDARGNVRTRQISMASRKFTECTKMIIRFLAPADVKGTTLLVHDYEDKDDNQWIYMPALRNVRRIVSTEKAKNFMGSEFTNADMSKPNLKDYEYKILGVEEYEGKSCWKIEAVCKTDKVRQENGFSKRVSLIDKNLYLCYKIEYYDLSDTMYRTQYISDYRKLEDGNYFAYSMTMENLKNGRKSEMIVDKFQLGSKLSENIFSPSMLDK